jgi:hypothetical protein
MSDLYHSTIKMGLDDFFCEKGVLAIIQLVGNYIPIMSHFEIDKIVYDVDIDVDEIEVGLILKERIPIKTFNPKPVVSIY